MTTTFSPGDQQSHALTDNDQDCAAQNNLDVISSDAALQGLSNIFHEDDDSDYDEPEGIPFSPIGMQAFTLIFNDEISLSLLQAATAFSASGGDDTGLVLWGASVTLAQYLIRYHPEIIRDKKIMELGCGGAVPSLVACHLGASHVLSTDFRQATLDHVQYHARKNKCTLNAELIDWEDTTKMESLQADAILAADVIYGVALVPPLLQTIEHYLGKGGILVIAARDGRRGIAEFRQLMKKNFVEVTSESHNETYLPSIPKQLEDDEISRERWIGNHSIYAYRWRNGSES